MVHNLEKIANYGEMAN